MLSDGYETHIITEEDREQRKKFIRIAAEIERRKNRPIGSDSDEDLQ